MRAVPLHRHDLMVKDGLHTEIIVGDPLAGIQCQTKYMENPYKFELAIVLQTALLLLELSAHAVPPHRHDPMVEDGLHKEILVDDPPVGDQCQSRWENHTRLGLLSSFKPFR